MNNPKNDAYYIRKILTDLHFIAKHMENVTIQTLEENEVLLDSMLFRLIQVQENTKKLTDTYKLTHRETPGKFPGLILPVLETESFTTTAMWIWRSCFVP